LKGEVTEEEKKEPQRELSKLRNHIPGISKYYTTAARDQRERTGGKGANPTFPEQRNAKKYSQKQEPSDTQTSGRGKR